MDEVIASKLGFEFIGGSVCLDFVNTVRGARGKVSYEGLTRYSDLISWSQQATLVTASEAEVLELIAQGCEEEALAVLQRAYLLREALRQIFIALSTDTPPSSADVEALNRELRKGTTGASIVLNADGLRWEWEQAEGTLDQMLGPVARSAALLLTSAEPSLIRQCANVRCCWLFVDTTKNHSRHYCRTSICGNKVRVRRHRQRLRDESASRTEA
ncbi:MAG TPA: CGNR zinc finger domain-containing protein [Ktedonobacteraceae bacterium]|nr:CGNR zinc finger domain-containing protein [Ktedonobacteraceae bacterium]